MIELIKYSFSQLVRKDRMTGLFVVKKQRKIDRFNLHLINSNEKLFNIAQNPILNLTLNENISILHRIIQINQNNFDKKTIYASQEILQNINYKMKDTQDENPFIGKLAFSLNNLQHYNDLNLWVQKMDYILANVFDDEFDEIYNIILGFDRLQVQLKEVWQIELYVQCFKNLKINIFDCIQKGKYNIPQLSQIINNLTNNHILIPDEIYQEIEFQTMKIIYKEDQLQEIQLQDLVNIGFNFYKGGFKGENIFNYIQDQFRISLEVQDKQKVLVGKDLLKFICWYNFYYQNCMSSQNELIQEYILYTILQKNYCKSLSDILQLHAYLNISQLEQNQDYNQSLKKQFLQLDQNEKCTLEEVQEFMVIRQHINQQLGNLFIDEDIIQSLDSIIVVQIQNLNPAQIFFFLNYLEANQYMERFPNFFHCIPELIYNKYINEVEFDDLCYFYVVFVLNTHILQNSKQKNDFHGNVNNIKQHIKFVTLRRGFKIDSHFHRLLNVVDLADFFEGGEV